MNTGPGKTAPTPIAGLVPNPKARLREQVHEVMRFKHYARRTEETYWQWMRRYILFHGKRHPRDLGAEEVRVFLSHLATAEGVSAATQNQALNALVFLYREVLHAPVGDLGEGERARTVRRRPRDGRDWSSPDAGRARSGGAGYAAPDGAGSMKWSVVRSP